MQAVETKPYHVKRWKVGDWRVMKYVGKSEDRGLHQWKTESIHTTKQAANAALRRIEP